DHHVDPVVLLLESLGQLRERSREGRRGEHGDSAIRPVTGRASAEKDRQRRRDDEEPPHEAAPGVSSTTFVALTTATATTPGSRPSSRTDSVLTSETIRCGPACSSTWDITRSLVTSVTMPTNRLRADRATLVGSATDRPSVRTYSARLRPSTTV